jgi:GNAT superfamily N-acetyltransferase
MKDDNSFFGIRTLESFRNLLIPSKSISFSSDGLKLVKIPIPDIIDFNMRSGGIMEQQPMITDEGKEIRYYRIILNGKYLSGGRDGDVGCLVANEYSDDTLYIRYFIIVDGLRGLGVGYSFIETLKKVCINSGYNVIELESYANSVIFWKKCGFDVIKERNSGNIQMVYHLKNK